MTSNQTTNQMLEAVVNSKANSVSTELSFDLKQCNSEEQAENYDRTADADFQDWVEAEFDGSYWEGPQTVAKVNA